MKRKKELSYEELAKVQMEMQEKIGDDICNPPKMAHLDKGVDEFFDKLKKKNARKTHR